MKHTITKTIIMGLVALVPTLLPTLASAVTVTVVRGINGKDLGLAEALPVETR